VGHCFQQAHIWRVLLLAGLKRGDAALSRPKNGRGCFGAKMLKGSVRDSWVSGREGYSHFRAGCC
jgi:hypothetical protein